MQMVVLKSVMKMVQVPCSTILPSMLLPVVIIKYLRMHMAVSGMQYVEKRLWNASRYMRTENLFMMAIVSVPYPWKPCGTSRRHPALRSRSTERILEVSLRSVKDNCKRKAGSVFMVRLFCVSNWKICCSTAA